MSGTTSDLPGQKWVEKIDHLGIAVKSLEEAIPIYETLLGQKVEHLEDVPDQLVRTAFFSVGESNFELLEPMDGQGAIGRYLETRRGGIHHVCLKVTDIYAVLSAYRDAGIQLIDEEPRVGAHNMLIAFVHPRSTGGVLIELAQPMASKV
jgi:methylmalonyl-CoA/ethylmalonyl-CoA epimerase